MNSMKKKVFIEGILLLAIGLLGLVEGVRLVTHRDPKTAYDILGPGFYILFLAIAWIAIGIIHLAVNYRKSFDMKMAAVGKEMRIRMIYMVLVFALYIFLIDIVGYIAASVIFFFLEFRAVGIKRWLTNAMLTSGLTITYYIVFVHYCSMVFPRGIFFK